MKINKFVKGALAAVFGAAVIGAGATGVAYEFVSPMNGAQPSVVWQDKAEQAVHDYAYTHKASILATTVEPVYGSQRPSGYPGFFDSKLIDFNVAGPLGFMKEKVTVQCNQARVDGFRGGEIGCVVKKVGPTSLV